MNISSKEAEKLLQYWVNILRLEYWDIDIEVLDDANYTLKLGSGSNAMVRTCSPKLSAHIFINDSSEDEINYLIVHELVHVMMDELECSVYSHIDKGRVGDEYKEVFDQQLELITHRLARSIITTHMKTPPPPPKKAKK